LHRVVRRPEAWTVTVTLGEPGSPIPPLSAGGGPPGGMDGYRDPGGTRFPYPPVCVGRGAAWRHGRLR